MAHDDQYSTTWFPGSVGIKDDLGGAHDDAGVGEVFLDDGSELVAHPRFGKVKIGFL